MLKVSSLAVMAAIICSLSLGSTMAYAEEANHHDMKGMSHEEMMKDGMAHDHMKMEGMSHADMMKMCMEKHGITMAQCEGMHKTVMDKELSRKEKMKVCTKTHGISTKECDKILAHAEGKDKEHHHSVIKYKGEHQEHRHSN